MLLLGDFVVSRGAGPKERWETAFWLLWVVRVRPLADRRAIIGTSGESRGELGLSYKGLVRVTRSARGYLIKSLASPYVFATSSSF